MSDLYEEGISLIKTIVAARNTHGPAEAAILQLSQRADLRNAVMGLPQQATAISMDRVLKLHCEWNQPETTQETPKTTFRHPKTAPRKPQENPRELPENTSQRQGSPRQPQKSSSWGRLGAILGHLGPSWGSLGAILGHLGAVLGLS